MSTVLRIDDITRSAASVTREGGEPLVSRCHVADRRLARAVGLLGTRRLGAGEGVLLRPCAAVHTFGMRYPLAVAFLDGDGRVLAVHDRVVPWRTARRHGAAAVLEATAGTFTDLTPGERLVFHDLTTG